jgi:8-oxo-dGTP pyrophosphatase MutT (NUDIX family)
MTLFIPPSHIRPVAICVFSHRGRILAAELRDPIKQETFYRPLGGSIEFGERAEQTVHREMREEVGAEVKDLRYLGTLENIFTYNGGAGHEIVLVYDGAFADASLYAREGIEGKDDDGNPFIAVWKSLDAFGPGQPQLYPDGLAALLRRFVV